MPKWAYTTLDKLGKIEAGKPLSEKVSNSFSYFWKGYIPLVDGEAVSKSNLYVKNCNRYYNLKGLRKSKSFIENTLCIVKDGNGAGDTSLLKYKSCLSQHVYGFTPKNNISYSKFIKYCLNSENSKKKIILISRVATAQPGLSKTKLLLVKFPNPPYEIQEKIGEILSIYDIILENNEKQVELLKKLKISLFKEWFIKLRFPHFEKTKFIDGIPENWKKVKLGDLSTIQKGSKPASHANLLVPGGGITHSLLLL